MTSSHSPLPTSADAIRLDLRSWPEVEAYLSQCQGIILPLGSTEQHGPTGAIGTDALTAEAVALEVGRRTGVLVAPTQAYGMAEHRGLPVAPRLRCQLANWFLAAPVMREARRLYGDREGHHATPSEIALTLRLEPSLAAKQRELPEPAPAGPIHGPEDFRQRHPDGRMGSDPFLATADHGERFLDLAATALSEDLKAFLT